MHFYLVLSVSSLVFDYIFAETTKEPGNEEKPSVHNLPIPMSAPVPWGDSYHINSLWAFRPASRFVGTDDDSAPRRVVVRQPHSLTRIAKTLTDGFNPYFQKGYFEPFERRPKPVTLVGLRKNGLFSRQNIPQMSSTSSEVAELQSPFNDVSNFWIESENP
ncbi:uncharacterized protein LOC126380429 isoform X4 [Pectinophora gossypiella]|uniref:uncharacterized protein LOC126380429 isoform X4 n=1 Tax=Pectinophora gossypiella TaxID=13191 RepID=UPI00214EF088|nr:uncharacterized protein LOC126380429 isoform X4 [Pectinophora gossypiella]